MLHFRLKVVAFSMKITKKIGKFFRPNELFPPGHSVNTWCCSRKIKLLLLGRVSYEVPILIHSGEKLCIGKLTNVLPLLGK